MDRQPKILNEEIVADMKVFKVAKVDLEFNGKMMHHSVVRFCGTASVLPITGSGNFLLERQFRTPVNSVLIEVPAGKTEKNEPAEECIRREIEEETGYRATEIRELFKAYTTCGCSDELMHYFVAKVEPVSNSEREHFPDEDESISLFEVTPDEAVDMIRRGEIIDAKTITLIAAYKAGMAGFEG